MDTELKDAMARSMFRFRRLFSLMHTDHEMHMSELAVLRKLAVCEPGDDMNTAELHHGLFITKPAVSQILSGLERKGYIRRDIDPSDRRRIKVTLTEDGHAMLKVMKTQTDHLMGTVTERFGEEDLRQLVTLLDRFADTMEQVRQEFSS